MNRRLIVVVAGLAVLAVAGALYLRLFAPTPIHRITSDPKGFDGKIVVVSGTVRQAGGLLGVGAYELEDDTGKIAVVTDAGVPPEGSRLTVRGMAKNAYTIGNLSLVVIVEKRRK